MRIGAEAEDSKHPPTLSLSLNALSPGEMRNDLRLQRKSMLFTLPLAVPQKECNKHIELNRRLRNETTLKQDLEEKNAKQVSSNGFEESCGAIQMTSYTCGSSLVQVTVFPGSATVEFDFSMLWLSMSDHLFSLADLSSEGIFHARQSDEVDRLTKLSEKKGFLVQPTNAAE